MSQMLSGSPLLKKANDEEVEEVDGGDVTKDKIVALYFSAMWCPSCRQFTPKLARFYKALKAAGKNFEIVLVSRDKEADDLKEYFVDHNGDWLAIPFGDSRIPDYLKKYEVATIPALKLVNNEGILVEADARSQVTERGNTDPLELFDEWTKKASV